MSKRVGVILSGCGVFDGAEIHESVLTILALAKKGYEIEFLAPNVEQAHVVNHHNGQVMNESRNVLVESARIARGPVRDVAEANADDFDGIVLPGGFGAAKNLCTFAFDGAKAKIDPHVERLVKECHDAGKPQAFLCIAPAVAAKALLGSEVTLTIGTDSDTAAGIEKLGAKHENAPVHKAVVDANNRVVSSPAYMLAGNILEVEASINAAIDAFSKMLEEVNAGV